MVFPFNQSASKLPSLQRLWLQPGCCRVAGRTLRSHSTAGFPAVPLRRSSSDSSTTASRPDTSCTWSLQQRDAGVKHSSRRRMFEIRNMTDLEWQRAASGSGRAALCGTSAVAPSAPAQKLRRADPLLELPSMWQMTHEFILMNRKWNWGHTLMWVTIYLTHKTNDKPFFWLIRLLLGFS